MICSHRTWDSFSIFSHALLSLKNNKTYVINIKLRFLDRISLIFSTIQFKLVLFSIYAKTISQPKIQLYFVGVTHTCTWAFSLAAGIYSCSLQDQFLTYKKQQMIYWGYLMNTDTIRINVYDRYGKKLIEGITPVNATNNTLPIFKDQRDL